MDFDATDERSFDASKTSLFFLGLATLTLSYGIVFAAGPIALSHEDLRIHGLICVLLAGLLGILYFFLMKPIPGRRSAVERLALLFPAYALLQVIPLPLGVVRILSPARAGLADAMSPVIPAPKWVTLSVAPSATVYHFLLLVSCTIVFLVALDLCGRFALRPWLVTLPLVLMGVGEAILGLAQVAGNPGAVASGTYLVGDHYGGFLAMTLPFVALYPFAMLASRDPDRQNEVAPALLVCTGLGLSTLIMTAISDSQSRMSLVASLISMMLVTIAAVGRGRWRRRISLIFGGTALMAILVFVLAPSTRLWMQFGEMEKNEDQALASGEALDLVGTYPVFGCGLGGFQSAFGKFDNSNSGLNHEYADNDYLQYLAELGIAGLLLAAIPLSIILVRLRSAWSQQRWDLRWITLACAGGVVAIAIHSLVNCDLYVPANLLASAWILGIAAHAGRSASLDNSAIEPSAIIVVPPTGVRSKSYR